MTHPYREMPARETGPRWGATWWARLHCRLLGPRLLCDACGRKVRWLRTWVAEGRLYVTHIAGHRYCKQECRAQRDADREFWDRFGPVVERASRRILEVSVSMHEMKQRLARFEGKS